MARVRKWISSGLLAALMALAAIVLFPLLEPGLGDYAGSESQEKPAPDTAIVPGIPASEMEEEAGVCIVGRALPAVASLTYQGASIQLFQGNALLGEAGTGSDGSFEFCKLAAGSYTLHAIAKGFPPVSPLVQEVRVSMEKERWPVELVLSLPREGVVMGPDGAFVANAGIQFGAPLAPSLGQEAREAVTQTDARGHFIIQEVPVGARDITAMHSDYFPGTVTLDTQGPLVIRLGGPASIEGRVTWSGVPLAGALILLIDPRHMPIEAETDDEGRFSFPIVSPGQVQLKVFAQDSGQNISDSSSFELTPSETRHVDFAFGENTAALEGALLNLPEDMAADAFGISVQVEGTGGHHTARPDANGYYLIEGLAPGTATVTLSRNASGPAPFTRTAHVQLSEGQRIRHDFDLESTAVIEGEFTGLEEGELGMVLVLPPGTPTPQTREELDSMELDGVGYAQALLNADGSYRVLVEGTERVALLAVAVEMGPEKEFRFASTAVDPTPGETEYIDFDLGK